MQANSKKYQVCCLNRNQNAKMGRFLSEVKVNYSDTVILLGVLLDSQLSISKDISECAIVL